MLVDARRFLFAILPVVIFTFCFSAGSRCASDQVLTFSLEDSSQSDVQEKPNQEKLLADGHRAVYTIPSWSSKAVAKPSITAASFVLMDAGTGQVLREYKAHTRRPNASTTKIMTSILVMESCSLTDKITASKKSTETLYTSIHLKPGEQISVKDTLAALLIRSANDASVAVAEHIAGSVPKFAKLMNDKAVEIGCSNTHFVTPNGLYDPNHYSSAYDLCLIARYAFSYPVFNELIKTRKYTLNSRTLNRQDLVLFSKSKFMKNYPGADGVKSGYVKQAGQCYVGSATRSNWRLVSTVLKSKNVSQDTAALMNFGFNAYRKYVFAKTGESVGMVDVGGGNSRYVAVAPDRDVAVAIPGNGGKYEVVYSIPHIRAPISKGQRLGTVTSILDGETIETVELRAVDKVDISLLRKMLPFMIGCSVLGCGMLLVKYGTTNSKNTCCCRLWLAALLRNINRRRQGGC